jgi:hypothetical protein
LKCRPILFSAPMVRALLDGRKTQTRRVVKPRKDEDRCASDCAGPQWDRAWADPGFGSGGYLHVPCKDGAAQRVRCPYGNIGDRLWVRETFCIGHDSYDGNLVTTDKDGNDIDPKAFYCATTDPLFQWLNHDGEYTDKIPWKPSIHMPRWASRITLEIADVRVQRVQDIIRDECFYEGVESVNPYEFTPKLPAGMCVCWRDYSNGEWTSDVRMSFRTLWDSINAKRGYSWKVNPWVWAISFKLLEAQA